MHLSPQNKWIVIDPIDAPDKIGTLFVPGNSVNQYRVAKLLAISECDETKGWKVGDEVFYDTLGAVSHKISGKEFIVVKAVNVVAFVHRETIL